MFIHNLLTVRFIHRDMLCNRLAPINSCPAYVNECRVVWSTVAGLLAATLAAESAQEETGMRTTYSKNKRYGFDIHK